MSFLKTLGIIIVKGLQIAIGITPIIQQAIPGSTGILQVVSQDLSEIAKIVVEIEVVGASLGLPGADKARAAAPLIAQIIMQSSVLSGKEIADGPLFTKGCTEIAGGIADVLNSLHANGVVTTSKASSTPVAPPAA